MVNLAWFLLRLVVGGLLAGHGAQKLFGWFGGYGVQGTSGWLESIGLRPGRPWALAAGISEFGGGLLTALGLLNPIGPICVIGSMAMAWVKVHWGKPIWVSAGGAELPLTNVAAVTAIALAGSGGWTLDRVLGIRLPRWLFIPGVIGALATAAYGLKPAEEGGAPSPVADEVVEEASAELQGGEEGRPLE